MKGFYVKTYNQKKFYGLLTFIILVAAVIRLFQIKNKGLCFWDEGIFYMGCKFFRWRSSILLHQMLNHLGFSYEIPNPGNFPGYPVFLQKPVHIVLLSISSVIGGMNVLIGVYHSIFYGLVSIFLTGILGKKLFNQSTGIIAAAWLALEPYHIHYSRLGLHETDSMVLLLLAVIFWLNNHLGRKFFIFLSGFLLMASLGASYRIFPFLGIIPLWDIYLNRKDLWSNIYLKRASIFIFACLIMFSCINLLYYFAFYPHYLWSQPGSYVELLKKKFFHLNRALILIFHCSIGKCLFCLME